MGGKEFKISRRKIWGPGIGFLAFVLLSYPITKIASDFDTRPFFYIAITGTIGIIVAIITSILIKEHYMYIFDDHFEIRTGKKVETYKFSEFAGSNVVKNYTNGIYTGSTREIKINQNGRGTKDYNCNALKSEKFSELVSYLSKKEFVSNHDEQVTEDYFNTERKFSITTEPIINGRKSSLIKASSVTILSAAVGIVSLIINIFLKNSYSLVVGIVGLIFAVYLFFTECYKAIKNYIKVKSIPDTLVFNNDFFVIGDKTLRSSEIQNISMVPPDYSILSRDMLITTISGDTFKYNFGTKTNSPKNSFMEYDVLFKTVKLWCITNKINFLSILG